jgi:hypothetical protein
MKCSGCGRGRSVDTVRWTLPDECSGCKDNKEHDDRKQLAMYKELKGEMEFDQVCELCVGQMEDVYSDR